MNNSGKFGPTLIRLGIGLIFLVAGITKLTNPAGIIGLVGNIGFPAAPLFGWIVILSEVLLGLAILIGYKIRYAVWPLIIILLVAVLWVLVPSLSKGGSQIISNILFHVLAITALLSLSFSGAGALAIDKSPSKAEEKEEM